MVTTRGNLVSSARLVTELRAALCSVQVPIPGIAACAIKLHILGPDEIRLESQAFRQTLLNLEFSGVVERIQTGAGERHTVVLWIDHNEVRGQTCAREDAATRGCRSRLKRLRCIK